MTENLNLLMLVESFQESVNQHYVDKEMAMLTEDAKFEIVGISMFSGKKKIKNIFEYDVGVKTQLQFINCKSKDNIIPVNQIQPEPNDQILV